MEACILGTVSRSFRSRTGEDKGVQGGGVGQMTLVAGGGSH